MTPVRVGIVGYGLSGRIFHAQLLRGIPEFLIDSVVTSKFDAIRAELPDATPVATVGELLERPIDLAILTSPTFNHFEIAKKLLLAGKNLVVEKPFVASTSEGNELIAIAKKKGALLSVFHNRRWDSGFLTVKKIIGENRVGDISLYISRFDRFRPNVNTEKWREQARPGSGLLYDIGSHLIDQALSLFGKPIWLDADIAKLRRGSIQDDYFQLTFGYPTMRAVLSASSSVLSSSPVFEVHGNKGSFLKYGMDVQESQLRELIHPGSEGWGIEPASNSGTLTCLTSENRIKTVITTESGQYDGYYRAILDAIRSNSPLPVTAEEGLQVIDIIEKCIQSSQSGMRVKL